MPKRRRDKSEPHEYLPNSSWTRKERDRAVQTYGRCTDRAPGDEDVQCAFPKGHGTLFTYDDGNDPASGYPMDHGNPDKGGWWSKDPRIPEGPPKVRDGQQVYTQLSVSAAPSDMYQCLGCGAQVMGKGPDTVLHDGFHARLDRMDKAVDDLLRADTVVTTMLQSLEQLDHRVDELDKDVERLGTGKATGKALDHLGRRLGKVETVVADLWHKQTFPTPRPPEQPLVDVGEPDEPVARRGHLVGPFPPTQVQHTARAIYYSLNDSPSWIRLHESVKRVYCDAARRALQLPRLNNEGSPSAPPVPEGGVPTPVVPADDEKTQQSVPEDDEVDETVCDWGSKTDRPCRIPRWFRHTHGNNGYLQVFGNTYMGEVRNEPEPVNSPRVWQLTVKQLRDRLTHEQDNAVVILRETDGSLHNLHASSQSGKATFSLLRVLDPTKSVETPPPGDVSVHWTQAGYDAAVKHMETNGYAGHFVRPYDERGGFKCSCGVGVNAARLGNWVEPEPPKEEERVRLFKHLVEDHHITSAQQSHLIERDLEDLRVAHGALADHSDLHRHCGWTTGPDIVNEPIVEASESPVPVPSSTESDEQPSAGPCTNFVADPEQAPARPKGELEL